MATKLYPPNISGTIPAFVGATLVVPFSLNRAVSKSEIAGFVAKIKTIQGSILLGTLTQTSSTRYNLDKDLRVSFDIPSDNMHLNIGQYYKIQLAFLKKITSTGAYETGYFSTVGVAKYTGKPTIGIAGLTAGSINNHMYNYVGMYNQIVDPSEKLYSSRLKLFDAKGNVLKDSGEVLHNITKDIYPYEANEDFTISIDLKDKTSYYLQYFITTTNGYTAHTPKYRIMQKRSVRPELRASLKAELSYEDGYVDLYLIGDKDKDGFEQNVVGSFIVTRAASNEDYIWNKVYEFTLQSQTPTRFLWRDYTVEQGITYKYSIQQYNDYGLHSERIESNSVIADFEDAFLYDGERQLKIRYNPKISSFKTDLLENKVETIGRKHPFIFRNGNVAYKEFPISGLISFQMDNNKLFTEWKRKDDIVYMSTDLSSQNILTEREFKLEVLDWLNDGKEKLFRSPTEGNYIVRLLNTSLSPTDTLGRMLHTFNSTAYEVADFSYENLDKYNFITLTNVVSSQMRWATVELSGHSEELDEILSNISYCVDAQIPITFTQEQYSRVLSNNYSLKDYFIASSRANKYSFKGTPNDKVLIGISNILNGLTIDKDTIFTAAQYSAIEFSDSKNGTAFTKQLEGMDSILYYTLESTVAHPINDEVIKQFEDIINNITYVTGQINTRAAYSIFATDMLPGAIIEIDTADSNGANITTEQIVIGATGSYKAEFENPVVAIRTPRSITTDGENIITTNCQGSITYSYISTSVNVFDTIRDLEIIDVPIQQWIGQPKKTYYDRDLNKDVETNDLIKVIENEKISITEIYLMRFEKRPLIQIFTKDWENPDKEGVRYYKDMDQKYPFDLEKDADCYCVYHICRPREDYTYQNVLYEKDYVDSNFAHGYYVNKNGQKLNVGGNYLIDGNTKEIYTTDLYSNKVFINGDEIDLTETERYSVSGLAVDEVKTLTFDNGIIGELSYQVSQTDYNIEYTDTTVNAVRQEYENQVNNLNTFRSNGVQSVGNNIVAYADKEQKIIAEIKRTYANYIRRLAIALKNYEGVNEIL